MAHAQASSYTSSVLALTAHAYLVLFVAGRLRRIPALHLQGGVPQFSGDWQDVVGMARLRDEFLAGHSTRQLITSPNLGKASHTAKRIKHLCPFLAIQPTGPGCLLASLCSPQFPLRLALFLCALRL